MSQIFSRGILLADYLKKVNWHSIETPKELEDKNNGGMLKSAIVEKENYGIQVV